jgi:hypothetical protein
MDPEMVLRECYAAFEASQFEKAAGYFADNFVLSGPTPQPIGKKEFVALQSGLIQAIPDWKFNPHNFHTQGDTVTVVMQITGTHTRTLPSLMPGAPEVPATGKHFSLPEEPSRATVKNGQITSFSADQVPGGGVMGIFQQLGIPMDV